MTQLTFEPLYYNDRLSVVNPSGDLGILTLWSPISAVKRKLAKILPEFMDGDSSRVAVVSNLYGDGMYAMFCNLLFNPQVRHLVAIGQDLGLPTSSEIEAFLRDGLEDVNMFGKEMKRIKGTDRIFPSIPNFNEERLRSTLTFRNLGKLSQADLAAKLEKYFNELPPTSTVVTSDRLRVDIPEGRPEDYTYLPSHLAGHQVIRRGPVDCWEELVVRGMRFGRPVMLRSGLRLELLNVKTVITDPVDEPEEVLAQFGFSIQRLRQYQESILRADCPEDVEYTYGNRLRGHFILQNRNKDTLQAIIDGFHLDHETRRGYITLWDNEQDLANISKAAQSAVPCLASLFFRHTEGKLSLSATFRSHNLLTAWLENIYGLMAIQRHVADAIGIPVGSITVISHSLGIDPSSPRYEVARRIADQWNRDEDTNRITGQRSLRKDPNGYFVVTIDKDDSCIVVEHRFDGVLIKQYRSSKASRIEREIIGDMAVSLVSHALWLGRELAAKEEKLRLTHTGGKGNHAED